MTPPGPRDDAEGIALVEGILARVGAEGPRWIVASLFPLSFAHAKLYAQRKVEDPPRFAAAQQLARVSVLSFEQAWDRLKPSAQLRPRRGLTIDYVIFDETHTMPAPDPRAAAPRPRRPVDMVRRRRPAGGVGNAPRNLGLNHESRYTKCHGDALAIPPRTIRPC
jgi:hypothetical protein